jgi:hypothetical protein
LSEPASVWSGSSTGSRQVRLPHKDFGKVIYSDSHKYNTELREPPPEQATPARMLFGNDPAVLPWVTSSFVGQSERPEAMDRRTMQPRGQGR